MESHMASIGVRPDALNRGIYSFVASGERYDDYEIGVLAAVLKGVDMTGLHPGESHPTVQEVWASCMGLI